MMSKITIYDTDAKQITDLCEEYGITEAELIQALMDVVRDEIIVLSEWL